MSIPMLLLALLLSFSQRLDYRHMYLRQQTADSVTVIASWSASNADSVRLQWGSGVIRTRTWRGRDSLRVARQATPTTVSVVMTPLRGATGGAARTVSIAIPARPLPAPTIDSAAIDTVRALSAGTPVQPPPVTGPIAAPGTFTPNLPSGLMLVSDADFENGSPGPYEAINWSGVTTQSASTHGVAIMPTDGSRSLRAWFPERDAGNGVGPLTVLSPEVNRRGLYMAVRMRYSPGYVLHTNTEKWFYPTTTVANSQAVILNVGGDGQIAGFDRAAGGDPPALVVGLSGAGVIPVGRWFNAEVYVRLNTPGMADGEQRVWIDGRLAWERRNVRLSLSDIQVLFLRGRLDFTRGGGPSAILTPPGGQWVDIDRLAFYAGN